MKRMLHTYSIDTRRLTPAERQRTEELVHMVSTTWGLLPSDTFIYVVHTECTTDEFLSFPFPDGCIIQDITG